MERGQIPLMVGYDQTSDSMQSDGHKMVRRTRLEILGSNPKRLDVKGNRRGTLKRMPGGVGGTAAKAAYPSRS